VVDLLENITLVSHHLFLPRDQPYDYALLTGRLRGYGAVRDKITRLLAGGEVVRVKKGLYVPGRAVALREVDPLVLSGMVSGPSCVSFKKALELHGLIPERVVEITCATTQRRREFVTPVGRFTYMPVPLAVFSAEVERREAAGGHFFLATRERALCDCAGRHSGLQRLTDVEPWLRENLRITSESLALLNPETVTGLAQLYRRRPVTLLARWLAKRNPGSPSAPGSTGDRYPTAPCRRNGGAHAFHAHPASGAALRFALAHGGEAARGAVPEVAKPGEGPGLV
jgi:hypothetical protein